MPVYSLKTNPLTGCCASLEELNNNAVTCASTASTTTTTNTNIKLRKAIEKIDKHVDDLEGDIDFFNKEREKQEQLINELIRCNIAKDTEINELKNKITTIEIYNSWVETKLTELEMKLNGHMS